MLVPWVFRFLYFSDIWSLGCVLYELSTLKHAVSIFLSNYTFLRIYLSQRLVFQKILLFTNRLYLKLESVANKKMIKKICVAVQNFTAVLEKEAWSCPQIMIWLFFFTWKEQKTKKTKTKKNNKKNHKFFFYLASLKRPLVIFWVWSLYLITEKKLKGRCSNFF